VSRRVLALNVLLGLVGALCAAGLIRELLTPLPLPPPPTPRPAAPTTTSVPAPAPGGSAGAYGLVVSRNLFSPSRSETPAGPMVAAGPRPLLHGVVMDGPKSRAYLEDATVKRTFGYAVGDAINGGRVQSIGEDRVVIARPDGLVEVLLQDPAKPRPGGPPAAGPTPPAAAPAATATPAVPVSRVPAPGSVPPRANER
jgi:hypothetical protein